MTAKEFVNKMGISDRDFMDDGVVNILTKLMDMYLVHKVLDLDDEYVTWSLTQEVDNIDTVFDELKRHNFDKC